MPYPFLFSPSQRYQEAAWWNKFVAYRKYFIRAAITVNVFVNERYSIQLKREYLHDMTALLIQYDRACTGRTNHA